ncbi:hypothetical protein ASF84_12835 [Pseudomonas sp. Leaf127]|uniref:iron-containing redox enzyme family protein n=1 Tax=Pseudomonas sp. Leaf127 TaxID=1736267 RepID=UPI000703419C|nr:iron-containing redox enzyme family protein [Pseudomonas sp. Leaf127]KQQ56172.1 hypothetical protein ASF84_12835 [Pseudomonas sp. Leaf127]
MTVFNRFATQPAVESVRSAGPASLYHRLLQGGADAAPDELATFLNTHLASAADLPCELPEDPADFAAWMDARASQVGEQYAQYLAARHAGEPRRFFSNKAHALYFLQCVAPTKLVDGAWLYSALQHADDWRYQGLIRTYLEELGDGDPGLNHVVLYRKLLNEHDCAPTHELDQDLYLQGALQLALGQAGDAYLPEMIGYNFGYEQLPLHLLITSFELNELGIDPYYFTLHVTIDNASTGHAQKAVEAVNGFLASCADKAEFMVRLRNGYRLNDLGVGTQAVIAGFDIEREVIGMLERKRSFGQSMHSDYCRLDGKTVNEWLATPGQIAPFLATLQSKGWIRRHEDPQSSRFWQLIDGPGAVMFGVFSGYEMQLLHDWIAGDWLQAQDTRPFRARFRQRTVRTPAETAAPEKRQAQVPLATLLERLSPSHHATPEGLHATRMFTHLLAAGGAR